MDFNYSFMGLQCHVVSIDIDSTPAALRRRPFDEASRCRALIPGPAREAAQAGGSGPAIYPGAGTAGGGATGVSEPFPTVSVTSLTDRLSVCPRSDF